MDAFFARNRLHAYLDGSLSSAEAEAVAAAIARDPALRAEHEQLRQTLSLVQRHGRAAAPMGLHDKVMAQVAAEPAPGGMVPRLRRLLRRTPVEAVALLAAAAAVVIMIQRPPAPAVEEEAPAEVAAVVTPPEAPAAGVAETPPVPAPEVGSPQPRRLASAQAPLAAEEEQEAAPEEAPRLFSGSTGYRISVQDPGMVRTLLALAQSSQGALYDLNNRPVQPRELTVEENFQRVMLVVPVDEAAAVDAWLRSAGGRSITSESSMVFGEGQTGFYVEVAYLE